MRKFLVYILTYVVMLMSGVGGVLLFTDQTVPTRAIQQAEPSALDKVVGNIMSASALTVGGEFELKEGETHLANVTVQVNMDLIDGFNKFNIDGSVEIERDSASLLIEFAYVEDKIYLNLLGAKYQATTDDIGGLIGVLGSALSGVLPEVDLSSMLDVNALMGLMENITEEQGETSNVLKLETPVGNITIMTDKEYNIQSIDIPTIAIDATHTLIPKVDLEAKQEHVGVSKPDNGETYADASEQFEVLSALINTISSPFNADLSILGQESVLTYDKTNLKLMSSINNVDLFAAYYDSAVYFNVGTLGVKCAGEDVAALKQFISDNFDLPNIEAQEVLAVLVEKIKTIDLSAITLDFLNQIVVDDNGCLTFEYQEFALKVTVVDAKIATAKIAYNGYEVNCAFSYSNVAPIEKPAGEYLAVAQVTELAQAGLNTVKSDDLNAVVTVKVGENNFTANVNYAFNGGDVYLSAATKIADNDISIVFTNGTAYLTYQGVKIKANKQTLENVCSHLGLNLPQVQDAQITEEQKQAILGILAKGLEIVSNTQVSMQNNILSVLNAGFAMDVTLADEKFAKLAVNYDDIEVEANITYSNFTQKTITDADYVDAYTLLKTVENVVAQVQNGVFVEFTLNYQGVSANGVLNYKDDNISAQIDVAYGDYSARVTIVGEQIFVTALGAKVKIAFSDFADVSDLMDKFGVTMQAVTVDKEAVLGLVNALYVVYNGVQLSVTYDGASVELAIAGEKLQGLTVVCNNQPILDLNILNSETVVTVENTDDYFSVAELLQVVEPVLNTIGANYFSGTAVVKVDVNNQLIEANIDYKVTLVDGQVKASATISAYGIEANIYYENNIVYVQVGTVAVSANINELDKLINFIETNFDVVLTQTTGTTAEGTAQAQSVVEIVKAVLTMLEVNDLSFVNTLVVTENSVSMQFGKLGLQIGYGETITIVDLSVNELAVDSVNIDSTSVELTLSTSEFVLAKPTCTFVDINDIITVADAAINTYRSNAISGQIELQVMDGVVSIDGLTPEDLHFVIDYNYSYNGGSIRLDAKTTVFGSELKVVLVDNAIYVTYQGIKVFSTLSDLAGYMPTTTAPTPEQIIALVSEVASNITLAYSANTLTVAGSYQDLLNNASVSVTANNNLLTNVVVTCDYVRVNVTFEARDSYQVPTLESDYVQVNNIVELAKDVVQLVNNKQVYAQVQLNLGDYAIEGLLNYTASGIEAQISTQILGKNVDVRYLNDTIYLDADGMKVKFATQDLDKVMNLVNKVMGDSASGTNVNVSAGIDTIKKYLSKLNLSYDGERLVVVLNNYNLRDFGLDLSGLDLTAIGIDLAKLTSGTLTATVDCAGNTLNGASVNVNDYFTASVTLQNTRCDIDTTTNGYFDIIALLPFVEPFIDGYLSGMFGQISANVPQVQSVLGEINCNYIFNNDGVQLTTTLLGQSVILAVTSGQAYVQINELKYGFNLNNIGEIVDLICTEFGITMRATQAKQARQTAAESSPILDDITLGDIKFDLLGDNSLQISYKDFVIAINISGTTSVDFEYSGITLSMTQQVGAKSFMVENTENFLPIEGVINKASSVYSVIGNGQVAFDLAFAYNDIQVAGSACVDFGTVLSTGNLADLKVSANLSAFGKQIVLTVINETIFVDFDGAKFKCAFGDFQTILNWVETEFGVSVDISGAMQFDLNTLISKLSQPNADKIDIATSLVNASIEFANNELSAINLEKDAISATITLSNSFAEISSIAAENYSNVVDLLPVCSRILQVYNSKAVALDAEIIVKLFGYDQTVLVGAVVDFNSTIKVDLNVELNGVSLEVYVRGSTIFINFAGLKIQFVESDLLKIVDFANSNFNANLIAPAQSTTEGNMIIDFINKNFNLGFTIPFMGETDVDFANFDANKITDLLGGIDLGILGKFALANNLFTIDVGAVNAQLNIENILDAVVTYNDLKVSATVNAIGTAAVLSSVAANDFATVEEILNTVQNIINTLNENKYTVNASTQVYNGETMRFDGNINASLDLTNTQKLFHGFAQLTGEMDIAVSLDYDGEYIYVDYSGLKLKIHQNSIKEIAGIVLALFGYDISSMDIFNDVNTDMNIGNLQNIMPTIDFGNPLDVLKVFKSINYSDGNFTIGLDGKKISGNENAQTMTLNIGTENNRLNHFDLNNIYTGVTSTEYFNLNIEFVEFVPVAQVEGSYFDISSISSLLRGVINTSELTDYHITATLDIKMTIIGINIDWHIPIDIQIKVVEGKPVIKAVIGPMPSVTGVNNDVPSKSGDSSLSLYKSEDRNINIYYLDNFVYIHRTETVKRTSGSGRIYEKKTKVYYTEFLNNIMYYVQYMTGFTDTIMSAIYESLEKAKNRTTPIDMGNVLLDYNNNNGSYNLKLNLKEISNDEKLDSISVSIKTSYVESAQKEYTTDLTMQMVMPLANGVNMNLESNDMKLINIGEPVDVSGVYAFVESYQYPEGQEWQASNGTWELATTAQYTISFESNGGEAVANITQEFNSEITLPTLADKVIVEGRTRSYYSFAGWYTTEDFKDGTQFTATTMPRGDTALYAKWTLVRTETVSTITFDANGGGAVSQANLSGLAGETVDLTGINATRSTTYSQGGWEGLKGYKYTVTAYTFAGWYIDSACTQAFNGIMPSENITLYAKWDASVTTEYSWSSSYTG